MVQLYLGSAGLKRNFYKGVYGIWKVKPSAFQALCFVTTPMLVKTGLESQYSRVFASGVASIAEQVAFAHPPLTCPRGCRFLWMSKPARYSSSFRILKFLVRSPTQRGLPKSDQKGHSCGNFSHFEIPSFSRRNKCCATGAATQVKGIARHHQSGPWQIALWPQAWAFNLCHIIAMMQSPGHTSGSLAVAYLLRESTGSLLLFRLREQCSALLALAP